MKFSVSDANKNIIPLVYNDLKSNIVSKDKQLKLKTSCKLSVSDKKKDP